MAGEGEVLGVLVLNHLYKEKACALHQGGL
jgi:hypothetical protein